MKNRNSRLVKIDEKGRVFLPSSIKKGLYYGEKLILTSGFEPCIYVFSETNWKRLMDEIGTVTPFSPPNLKNTLRHLQGNSEELELDSQGRILIPGHLFEYARLKDRVFFVRMDTWFEIWNPEVYRKFMEQNPIKSYFTGPKDE